MKKKNCRVDIEIVSMSEETIYVKSINGATEQAKDRFGNLLFDKYGKRILRKVGGYKYTQYTETKYRVKDNVTMTAFDATDVEIQKKYGKRAFRNALRAFKLKQKSESNT